MSDGLWRATVARETTRALALGVDGALPRGVPQLVRGEASVSGDVGEQAPGVVLAAVVRVAEDTGYRYSERSAAWVAHQALSPGRDRAGSPKHIPALPRRGSRK